MLKLVFLRHGQSIWNLENKFTGWADVDLTEQGILEAHEAGRLLKAEGYTFDVAFTSVLKRAIRTLWIVLDEMDLMWLPIYQFISDIEWPPLDYLIVDSPPGTRDEPLTIAQTIPVFIISTE